MMKHYIILLIGFVLIFSVITIAEDNVSNESNITENITLNESVSENITPSNESVPGNITQLNESVSENITQKGEVADFTITDFIPQEFKIGDAQFNIRVKNIGNVEIKDLVAIVSGKGFSTYDVIAIDSLKPEETSYIIVMGNFRERGNITLNIRLFNKLFYQNVTVIDPNYEGDQQRLIELKKEEEAKNRLIDDLSVQLGELEANFTILENEFNAKKAKNYDLSGVNLEELRKFLRDARSSIVVVDTDRAKVSLSLALDEYNYQKNKLDNAHPIKRSISDIVRGNLILFSSMAGAIITLFTLHEILKKKQESLSKKIMEVKVTFEKKVEKKEEPKKKKQKSGGKKKKEEKKE